MGTVKPECRNFQEHITAAVDNVLGLQEWEKLEGHLAQCDDCKTEFEVEKFARNIVKSQCKRVRAPGHMLDRINAQLSEDEKASLSDKIKKNISPA